MARRKYDENVKKKETFLPQNEEEAKTVVRGVESSCRGINQGKVASVVKQRGRGQVTGGEGFVIKRTVSAATTAVQKCILEFR